MRLIRLRKNGWTTLAKNLLLPTVMQRSFLSPHLTIATAANELAVIGDSSSMRLSLFSRLVLGYLVVFALVMTVSIYAVGELRRIEKITRSILDRDNRVLDYEKRLSDSFLSQIRYERKYTIAKDPSLY